MAEQTKCSLVAAGERRDRIRFDDLFSPHVAAKTYAGGEDFGYFAPKAAIDRTVESVRRDG
jgi:hypothetical protein